MIQLMLFSLFLYMYGLPALVRMNQRATIVIKSKVDTDGILAPSFTIAARDQTTGLSWKMEKRISNNSSTDFRDSDILAEQCKDFPTVEQCLDSLTFDWTDFIKGTLLGYREKTSLKGKGKIWQPDLTIARFGRTYTFHPEMMIGPDADEQQLIILLDNNYMYDIFVHDTNFFILNENCCVLPSTYVRLMPNSSNVYYRISATQHQELNSPKDPCVEDEQYNFSVCVKENLARKVGCRPSWDIWSDQTIKNCTKIEEHR